MTARAQRESLARKWRARARRAVLAPAALLAIAMGGLMPGMALAQPRGSAHVREHLESARREGNYTFCSKPRTPLLPDQRALCPLAEGVSGCDEFLAACNNLALKDKPKTSTTWREILDALGAVAKMLVWLLVAAVVIAIAFPLLRALLRARRDRQIADAPVAQNVASLAERVPPPEPERISDAEQALREADDHARRGDLSRALSLYLAASLAALDRRGAIRLARHRTNGEYVRSCVEDGARQPLREIVREVDKVEFGKLAPTHEGVARVASRAADLVRSSGRAGAARGVSAVTGSVSSMLMSLGLIVLLGLLSGCGGGHAAGSDPAGDELPIDLLRRSGYVVSYLGRSLAALPMPDRNENTPVVVVDLSRVPLEDESAAQLLRWVSEGGVAVLFGTPTAWPSELHAAEGPGEVTVDVDPEGADIAAGGAHVARPRGLKWPESEPVAWSGEARDSVYAATKIHGKGVVVGVAGNDLATNVGVLRPQNAAAFVALIDVAMVQRAESAALRGFEDAPRSFEVQIARREDGIPPPSNPFSALVQAGLGKGSWHALAAAVVLFLAFGIRHARPRPEPPLARRAFAEHVEATGAFYGRARAHAHALAAYGRFAEMRLRDRCSATRGGETPVQFLAARADVTPEEAERVWKRATEARAEDPLRGDELATIRDLGAMLAKALETTR